MDDLLVVNRTVVQSTALFPVVGYVFSGADLWPAISRVVRSSAEIRSSRLQQTLCSAQEYCPAT